MKIKKIPNRVCRKKIDSPAPLNGDVENTNNIPQTKMDVKKNIPKMSLQVLNNTNKNTAREDGGVKYSIRLTDDDLSDYLRAGDRKNKNKLAAFENNKKIILTSNSEIVQYIDSSIDKRTEGLTVAYGKVNSRLAKEVSEYSNGQINIDDNYLELVPYNIQHAFDEHHHAKAAGDIDLDKTDFENIPEYLDTYDELLYAIKYSSGNTKICVSKVLPNGRILIIETVSKSRGALQFKNAIGVTEEKYQNEYVNVYKNRSGKNTRGSNNSNNSLRDLTTSNNRIAQNDSDVNNQYMQNGEKNSPKYSFAGKKARTSNLSKLGEAIKLENEGKLSSEEIRQQTGWFKGYDNKWRFEIDDSKMKVSTAGKYSRNPDISRHQELLEKIYFEGTATPEEEKEYKALDKALDSVNLKPKMLGDLIEHDELFTAYPQLADIGFKLLQDTGNANGWYSEFDNEIVVKQNLALKPEELKSTLIHEIQHAIQHIEMFAGGSNPDYFAADEGAKYNTLAQRKYEKEEKRLMNIIKYADEDIRSILAEYNSETMYMGMTESEYAKAYDKAAKQIKNTTVLDIFWDYAEAREAAFRELSEIEDDTARDSYRKTAGEIEARDVQKRLNYSAEQRKNIRPDIDREDVVFVEGVIDSFSADDIARYTEKEYNDYGWVAVNEVLTGNELKSLNSQFADATKLNFKYPKSSANEYMILVGDTPNSYEHLVYIKGDINHPIITQVIGVFSDVKKYQRNYLDEVIILNEQKVGNPFRIIEDYAGEEIFFRLTLQDYHSYNELQTERSGTGSTDNSRGKQNGRRSSGKNHVSGIKFSLQETALSGATMHSCIEITKKNLIIRSLKRKVMSMTTQRAELIQTLKKMNLPKEELLNLMQFMDTPQMEKEMLSAMKTVNFKMSNREIWNAAGEIVKKHLK